MNKIQFNEDDDLIDIRFDNVFKAVFTKDSPASKGALSKLISAFIGREVQVEGINTNEPAIDNLRDRQIRFDISCKAKSGELINVEMSLNPKPFEPVRLEFFAGKLFIGQDIRGVGKDYNNLKQAFQIAILAREHFFPDGEFLHTFEYYDPVHDMPLKGKSRIITVELSKLEKVVEKPASQMSDPERWAVYFEYLTDRSKRSKINQIVNQEEGIAMASEVLITITKEEREQAWALSKLKYELDTQSNLSYAKRQGREEGLAEVAKNALAKGLSLEMIQEITGLDIDTIKKAQ